MTPGLSAESGSTQQRRVADGNTQITLIWVLSSGRRQISPDKQNGGAVCVQRLMMRLHKAAGEVFRATPAALAVAGSGPAGHRCQQGLDSSSGWPAGAAAARSPQTCVSCGAAGVPSLLRPAASVRRSRGWSSGSGAGLLVSGDDRCRDASSLADLDAVLLRPFTHGRRVVTVPTGPAGATAACRPACVLDIPAEVPAYLRRVLLRQVDLVRGAIDGEANCRVCL
jgi:hypothetical protein